MNYKKILLVHPLGYSNADSKSDISRIANMLPPLGLASLASYLDREGIDSDIIDCYAVPDSTRHIQDYLKAEKPAFIGLSCSTSTFADGIRVSELAKETLPEIKVIFGGAHVSALKNRIIDEFPVVDFVVAGEGEETLTELIKSEGNEPASIQGIIYRENHGESVFTGYREKSIDLDTLPFPAYEKIDGFPDRYRMPPFNYPSIPHSSCVTSRGCPYQCSYCDRSVFRRSFRYNSAEYIFKHLVYLKENFGIRHVNFYDDQFTFNRKRIKAFTDLMAERSIGMTFNCVVRAEHVDMELLHDLKKAGCWLISLGIETGDEELLAQHRQNADLDMLANKIRMIKKAGIRTKGLLMMGLPGETEQSIEKSIKFVQSLPIDELNLAKFTPFPGSPIYENIHELGDFDEDWEKMDCMNFMFVPKGITREKMEEMFMRFYKTHFKRPSVLLGYIAMIWRSPDSWRRLFINGIDFIRFAISNKRHGND